MRLAAYIGWTIYGLAIAVAFAFAAFIVSLPGNIRVAIINCVTMPWRFMVDNWGVDGLLGKEEKDRWRQ